MEQEVSIHICYMWCSLWCGKVLWNSVVLEWLCLLSEWIRCKNTCINVEKRKNGNATGYIAILEGLWGISIGQARLTCAGRISSIGHSYRINYRIWTVKEKWSWYSSCSLNTISHWCWDKMAAIVKTTFSIAYFLLKMYTLLFGFHWRLFLRVQFTISQHLFRWLLSADQETSHYLNEWWSRLLTYMSHSASLWPRDAIWWHKYMPDGTKPLHEQMLTYHQSAVVVLTQEIFHRNCGRYNLGNKLENDTFKIIFPSARGQWV